MKKTLFMAALLISSAAHAQTSYLWQHSDVQQAWNQGFKGQGVKITVHDEDNQKVVDANLNFQNRWDPYFNSDRTQMSHAEAVRQVAQLTAPDAQVEKKQWVNNNIVLDPNKFNVVNASYGRVGGTDADNVAWARQNLQLVRIAYDGTGVVVKAAGNNYANLSVEGGGDGINMALKTAGAVIFAGALSSHGTEVKTYRFRRWSYTIGGADRASYSNKPGTDTEYQKRYLMVGVDSDKMTIAGTSFAAPQISAYAAIVSSKFTGAQPAAVVSQLLNTARTDTIRNYNPEEHGRGEASLSRALAPRSIQ